MNGYFLIMISMLSLNLILSAYIMLRMKEMEDKVMAQTILSRGEEKKGASDERKKKISQSQKARWAKKKGANLIAPISWPEESHQAVN